MINPIKTKYMVYNFQLPQFPNVNFIMNHSFFTGKQTLLMDNKVVKQLKEKGKPFELLTNNGLKIKAYPKATLPDFVPNLYIDGEKYLIAKPLKWYQHVFGALPVLLLFVGGFLGGILGVTSSIINFSVFRTNKSNIIKYFIILAVNITSLITFYYLTTFISSLIH